MFVCLQLGDDRHHELEVDQSWTIKELKQALHDLSTSFDQQQLCVNGALDLMKIDFWEKL